MRTAGLRPGVWQSWGLLLHDAPPPPMNQPRPSTPATMHHRTYNACSVVFLIVAFCTNVDGTGSCDILNLCDSPARMEHVLLTVGEVELLLRAWGHPPPALRRSDTPPQRATRAPHAIFLGYTGGLIRATYRENPCPCASKASRASKASGATCTCRLHWEPYRADAAGAWPHRGHH